MGLLNIALTVRPVVTGRRVAPGWCKRWRQVGPLFVMLFCVWTNPSVAQEEINLTQSINVIPGSRSIVKLITKIWHNESDARNRFVISLFARASQADQQGSYYEQVLNFANGKRVEFSDWESPDCSLSQSAVFRVGDALIVGTAERLASATSEIVPQSDPRPQLIRLFVLKETSRDNDPGKSPVWFDAVSEGVTDKNLCTAKDVRAAISDFLNQNMTHLKLSN